MPKITQIPHYLLELKVSIMKCVVSSHVFQIVSCDYNSGVFLIYLYSVLFLIQSEKVIDVFGHQGA